ncbi:lantibiotic immunity ABC transporter MutE/EpiE family permease subunit [Acetobacterium sp.]|uniref:lantibiotic immunity ABC transporter MutE/EpiE family permease subunit n=1 Tax=Acetobacterium sp. TaxID=1872094 RepID=UPI002F3FC401
MLAIIHAEFQKSRGSSIHQFVIMAPVAVLVLSYCLGGGQNGAYNWWYVMFLPGLVAILSSMVIGRDKILGYKGLFLFPDDKAFFWIGKILYLSVLVVVSSLIFMFGIAIMGYLDAPVISFQANMAGGAVLVLTALFELPVCMFLADRYNLFAATLFNIVMVMVSVVAFQTSSILQFSPYGVGIALMCPILHILPNGIPIPEGSPLLINNGLIMPMLGCLVLFLVLTGLTALLFRGREEK